MAKKILITSNYSKFRSGFGKNSKILLTYLHSRKNPDGSPKWECVEMAQAMKDGDPQLRGMPWKCYGGVPATDDFLIGQPRGPNGEYDPNLGRLVSYGAAMLETVLKAEKPFATIEIEDPWCFSVLRKFSDRPFLPFWDTEWFDKCNFILVSPLDSLPIYKPIVENIHKIKHFFVKSSFAQKELHRLGHEHVGLWPCLMDVKDYRVFSDEEKKENRAKYGISENCLVFGMVFRNQGRKLPVQLIEALKKFKDKNPEVESKLLLVTGAFEGWDIKSAVEEMGLDPNDVLCSHLCYSCDATVLKAIETPESDCPKCGTQKALRTVSIEKGVDERELINLYNLMDGYIQAANAGGYELPLAECSFAAIPASTVNYSFGEMFIDSGEVYSLDFAYSREIGTNFLRANPSSDSICDFMAEIYKNPEENKARGLRFREWAMKTIHPDITLEKIEKYLESLPDQCYNYEFRTEKLDPNAPFPTATDDANFIKELVYNFFGNKIDENHQDFKTITQRFANGTTRQQIYEESKEMVLSKMGGRPFDPAEFFIENGKKRLMWDMGGDFGDSLVALNVLDRLHELYLADEWDLYICCLPQYKQVYEHLTYISGFVPFTGVKHFELWEGTRNHKKWVDVWISPQTWRGAIHNGADFQEFHPYSDNFKLTDKGNVLKSQN